MTGSEANGKPVARERLTSEQAIQGATGRDWATWIAVLDAWGAVGREHGEITGWLAEEHRVQRWWAQTITVEYERERGLREPGENRDSARAISASRTVGVSVDELFGAFTDPAVRALWLPGAVLREQASVPGRSVRFDWTDGSTRVNVGFLVRGDHKSQVALIHERLPDIETAATLKIYWRDRLDDLKYLLES
ncbi:MAG TPA: DUF4287 domain-containing protein [Mycobacteriales bacterium]|nr:DUF4287 domain-containing protein [Mycobacteriales bacterium]